MLSRCTLVQFHYYSWYYRSFFSHSRHQEHFQSVFVHIFLHDKVVTCSSMFVIECMLRSWWKNAKTWLIRFETQKESRWNEKKKFNFVIDRENRRRIKILKPQNMNLLKSSQLSSTRWPYAHSAAYCTTFQA